MYLLHAKGFWYQFWVLNSDWRYDIDETTVVFMRLTSDKSTFSARELTGNVWRVLLRISFGVSVRLSCCNYTIFRYSRTADVFAQCHGQLSARSFERFIEGWQAQRRWHAKTNVTRWQPSSEEDEGPTTSFCTTTRWSATAQVLSSEQKLSTWCWSGIFFQKQGRQQAWLFVNRLKVILVEQSRI